MLTQAGIYQIPLHDYLADPAPEPSLSASVAHLLLLNSPQHAWLAHPQLNPAAVRVESSRLDFGTIAHAILLEQDRSRIVSVPADDWRGKEARELRDEARVQGKLPILEADLLEVEIMVERAHAAIAASELAKHWEAGLPEHTLLWQEEGVWCRSRPDWAAGDWRVLADYKSTGGSANPDLWARTQVLRHGYDLQAALAIQGVTALKHCTPTVVFIVQEIEPPYAVSFVSLSPAWLALAQQRLRAAQTIWQTCLARNHWPAYPTQIAYAEPPAWAAYAAMEDAHDYVS